MENVLYQIGFRRNVAAFNAFNSALIKEIEKIVSSTNYEIPFYSDPLSIEITLVNPNLPEILRSELFTAYQKLLREFEKDLVLLN